MAVKASVGSESIVDGSLCALKFGGPSVGRAAVGKAVVSSRYDGSSSNVWETMARRQQRLVQLGDGPAVKAACLAAERRPCCPDTRARVHGEPPTIVGASSVEVVPYGGAFASSARAASSSRGSETLAVRHRCLSSAVPGRTRRVCHVPAARGG